MTVMWAKGKGYGELLFNGYRVLVWEDEQILERDNGDGFITMGVYLMSLNCLTKKMVKIINFMLCVFYHNKNNTIFMEL